MVLPQHLLHSCLVLGEKREAFDQIEQSRRSHVPLTTPGKAIVENNTFQRCRAFAISMSADSLSWFESAPVRDVLIRGNTFIECDVVVNPALKTISADEPIHENIRIIGNNFDRAGVSAMGARNLTITGNRSASGPLPINIDRSSTEVKIGDN